MEEKLFFSTIIDDYEKGRSKYPKEIFSWIKTYADIKKESKLLEVGAGPGTATDQFIDYKVDILEISDEQVGFLKKRYADHANISVKKSLFEDFNADHPYDLLYSATAFHWIKPEIAYMKANNCLKKGGTLALFWNMTFASKSDSINFSEAQRIVRKYCSGVLGEKEDNYTNCQKLRWLQQIYKTGCFSIPTCKDITWIEKYDARQFILWVKSLQSNYFYKLDSKEFRKEITEYFDSIGGFIDIPCSAFLIMAKKVTDEKDNYIYIPKENLKTVFQLEELGKYPDIVENHFLHYADEVLYIMQNDKVYGIITPNDIIKYYNGKKKNKINRNFRCLRNIDYRGAEMLFAEISTIHEAAVIENGNLLGVIRCGKRKTPTEWKTIRENLKKMMKQEERLSLCDLFKSLTKIEQKELLKFKFDQNYIELFQTEYDSRNY